MARYFTWLRVPASAAVAALVLIACGADEEPDESETPQASFYQQEVEWEDCGNEDTELRCGAVTVPLDHSTPDGETLEIALAARGDSDNPHLLINPGGPGISGIDTVTQDLSAVTTAELLDAYTVVGFDPRGVHRSEGIECMSDSDYDDARQNVDAAEIDDDEAYAAAVDSAEELAAQCAEQTGELLGHVDTGSAARDMDIIRAALNEDALHYMGFSYGTKLGMAYAEEFPQHVGRFVLDAMVDVSLDADELSRAQAQGFESALHGFAQWCIDSRCPVAGEPADVVDAVAEMFEDVAENPRTGDDGRIINVSTLVSGFITPMYSPQGWPMLRDGLDAALGADDFTAFQHWADLQAGRAADGSYEWISSFAFQAVMCMDYPTASSEDQMGAEAEALAEAAPTFGPYLGYEGIFCQALPHDHAAEPWTPSEDLPEMLFIGTTGDPATPVGWAEDMHEMVPTSSLLIYDGEGHVAYRPGAECVTGPVDAFLLTGELFEGRRDC